MGPPQVDLFAATSGTDSDWVVKLIDVYPNEAPEGADQGSKHDMSGYRAADRDRDLPRPLRRQLRQAARADGRARSSIIASACPTSNHVFLPGHRIMVQVQSSLFPLYDRNPQTFVPNIFYAQAGRLPEGDAERLLRRPERRAQCYCRSFPNSALPPARGRRCRSCACRATILNTTKATSPNAALATWISQKVVVGRLE